MRELARSTAEREKAETVMHEFAATWGFRVHPSDTVQLAKQTLDDLLRGIAKREAASDAAIHQIPILHIWEMNTSGSQIEKKEVWQPMAKATKPIVMWTWYADLVTEPNPVLRMVSPALVWSRTIDFPEHAIFQFA